MRILLILSFFCLYLNAFAQAAHRLLRNGDADFRHDRYDKAGNAYKKALEADPNNPKAAYNLGNARYQEGKFEDASALFERALPLTHNPAEKADVLHNLGNSYLKQQKFKDAVQAYENSLRLRPGDPDTKVNLQLAKRKQQEQQQKQQQQQQQPPQNQKQNQDQQPKQQPNDQNQNKEDKAGQMQEPNQPDQKKQNTTTQMSPEEAKRLLETAVGNDDKKNARKYREQEREQHPKTKGKDW